MDTGLWTLRCQSCREIFTLELTREQKISDFSRSHTCPNCHKKPDEIQTAGKRGVAWHRVIGFHSKKPPRL